MPKLWDILDLMRIDKLSRHVGYMLIFLPCAMGTGLYSSFAGDYKKILLFFIGSVIMRSAGCIINDILDRDIDQKVERTKNRPIADGRISVVQGQWIFFILSFFGFVVLVQFSKEAIIMGGLAMFLLLTYPLAKRITFWPQLYLGLTFNIGILISVMDAEKHLTAASIILYVGGVLWTLYYDTLYAFADLECDKKIKVKSLAVFLERKNYKLWLGVFSILANICVTIALLITHHNIKLVFLGFLFVFCMQLWQLYTLNIKVISNCLDRFKANVYIGLVWSIMALI